jgi:hypothetical protein
MIELTSAELSEKVIVDIENFWFSHPGGLKDAELKLKSSLVSKNYPFSITGTYKIRYLSDVETGWIDIDATIEFINSKDTTHFFRISTESEIDIPENSRLQIISIPKECPCCYNMFYTLYQSCENREHHVCESCQLAMFKNKKGCIYCGSRPSLENNTIVISAPRNRIVPTQTRSEITILDESRIDFIRVIKNIFYIALVIILFNLVYFLTMVVSHIINNDDHQHYFEITYINTILGCIISGIYFCLVLLCLICIKNLN